MTYTFGLWSFRVDMDTACRSLWKQTVCPFPSDCHLISWMDGERIPIRLF